jgi:hypothetical protein
MGKCIVGEDGWAALDCGCDSDEDRYVYGQRGDGPLRLHRSWIEERVDGWIAEFAAAVETIPA